MSISERVQESLWPFLATTTYQVILNSKPGTFSGSRVLPDITKIALMNFCYYASVPLSHFVFCKMTGIKDERRVTLSQRIIIHAAAFLTTLFIGPRVLSLASYKVTWEDCARLASASMALWGINSLQNS